jgi:DNA-binding response OmpR family regulator
MNKKADILLVEDDRNLGFVIKDNLELNGFAVTLCEDGEIGWAKFKEEKFQLCILDVMLPKKDGISLATEIRKINVSVPILFLTAKSLKEDKIAGFKAGGDDYIIKPFSIEELLLRIEVFLKRSSPATPLDFQSFQIGAICFDCENLSLENNGKIIHITQKEAEILKLLCVNKNKVLKREEILLKVWGNDDYFTGRSLDVFISKLRAYLKKEQEVEILNIHGVGFKMTYK